MKVSLKWLKELVDINVSHEELARLFSLRSAEVDSLYKLAPATNLVVGEILECVEHPDSDHLHITTVNVGKEVLTIVCGAPNVKKGQKIIVALDGAKLPGGTIKKSMLRGIESNGMNCSLEELGIDSKFQGYDGIYYLDDNAPLGEDPIKYLHLDDDVLEIELTPNRQDLLSIIGVAYDAKAMCNSTMHLEELKYETKAFHKCLGFVFSIFIQIFIYS